jgi:putative hydrolase of the HAD superfamily
VKAIMFDLDETLLNREESLRRFIGDQYKRLFSGLMVNEEDFSSRFIEWDKRGYVWKDEVYAKLIDCFSLNHFSTEELVQDYLLNFARHATPFAGVHHVLSTLKRKGYLLGLITNGREDLQSSTIKALDIEQYFDLILISESIGIKKPDPRIFVHALNELHVEACNAIYVGDHPINDIEAAIRCGITGIWKQSESRDSQDFQYSIKELPEIFNFLENQDRNLS